MDTPVTKAADATVPKHWETYLSNTQYLSNSKGNCLGTQRHMLSITANKLPSIAMIHLTSS